MSESRDTRTKRTRWRTNVQNVQNLQNCCALARSKIYLILSRTHSLSHSILVITLGIAVGPMYSWLYLGADMLIFLLYKIVRDDFYYWLPINGIKGIAVSLIVRMVLKIISDFTSSPHFRHPFEMGGLYFTLNMFLPYFGLIATLFFIGEDNNYGFADPDFLHRLWQLTLMLGGGLIFFISLFLCLMRKEYRGTFFSTVTGG